LSHRRRNGTQQPAQKRLTSGGRHINDVVGHQRNIVCAFLLNRRKVHHDFFTRSSAGLLSHEIADAVPEVRRMLHERAAAGGE